MRRRLPIELEPEPWRVPDAVLLVLVGALSGAAVVGFAWWVA